MTTHELLLDAWIWHPAIALAFLAVAIGLHIARFRLAHPARTTALVGAGVALVVALLSPVAALARGTLFSAHMLQHMLLTLAVPPLVLLAIPPMSGKHSSDAAGRAVRWPSFATWGLGVGAMWIWHAPTLCNLAATSDGVRALQNVSLLAMGGAFWWPILGPRLEQRLPEPMAIGYLATACAACTVLGVAITFSPVEVCSIYGHSVDPLGALPLVRGNWGLTPPVDQQLGGLLMWVPGCTIYAAAILTLVARFYGAPHTPVAAAS